MTRSGSKRLLTTPRSIRPDHRGTIHTRFLSHTHISLHVSPFAFLTSRAIDVRLLRWGQRSTADDRCRGAVETLRDVALAYHPVPWDLATGAFEVVSCLRLYRMLMDVVGIFVEFDFEWCIDRCSYDFVGCVLMMLLCYSISSNWSWLAMASCGRHCDFYQWRPDGSVT